MFLSNEQIASMRRRRFRNTCPSDAIADMAKYNHELNALKPKPIYSTPLLRQLTPQQDNIYVNPSRMGSTPTETIVNAVNPGKMHFTMDDYLNAGGVKHTKETLMNEDPAYYRNAEHLIDKLNKIGEFINSNATLSSGFRTRARQVQIYREMGKKPVMNSLHMTGHALDIRDVDGRIKQQIKTNKELLNRAKKLGLYFENFGMTPTWVHVQDVAPGYCGNQIWSADNFLALL